MSSSFEEWVDQYASTMNDIPSLNHYYAFGIKRFLYNQVVVDALGEALGEKDPDYQTWVDDNHKVLARLKIIEHRLNDLGRDYPDLQGRGITSQQILEFDKLRVWYMDVVEVKFRKIAGTYSVFERRYQPIPQEGTEELSRPWNDPIFQRVHERYVWSIVEGDNGSLYFTPGYATVNVLGRVLCTNPWSDIEYMNPGYRW